MSSASAEAYDKLNVASPRQLTYVDAAANRRGIVSFMCVGESTVAPFNGPSNDPSNDPSNGSLMAL